MGNLAACDKCGTLRPKHIVCTECGTYRKKTAIDVVAKTKKKHEKTKAK
jgi:ribosomal protein L32